VQNKVAGSGELRTVVRDELVGPKLEPLETAVLQITKALKEKLYGGRLFKSGGENHRLKHRYGWIKLSLRNSRQDTCFSLFLYSKYSASDDFI